MGKTHGVFSSEYTSGMAKDDTIWNYGGIGETFINAIGEVSMKVRKGKGWEWADISDPDMMGSDATDELGERWEALTGTCEKVMGRFHFRGGTDNGKVCMRLSTEFVQDITNKYFWRRVISFADNTGGFLLEMDRDFFPDRKMLQKHVEVVWNIDNMSGDDVLALIKEKLIPASNDIWREGGNHVS